MTDERLLREQAYDINKICNTVHQANQKWWTDIETGARLDRNVPEMLCLVHSEISEALEGYRKGLMDSHLPDRTSIEVELADTLIRIFDIGAGLGLDLGGAYADKMRYNATRYDHTHEARRAVGGKKF